MKINNNSGQNLYIVFQVDGMSFSVNSKYVDAIMQLPKYEKLYGGSPCISGMFPYRGNVIAMFDLRTALGLKSMLREFDEFAQMMDARKTDHVRWVDELERTLKSDEPFTLATDPHQCALGKWYDGYKSDNNAVNFHLRKIDDPHKKLHQAALEAQECKHNYGELEKVLHRVRNESMPVILKLLDETKEVFRTTVYHEMVLLLSGGKRIGIVVDEVLSVEELSLFGDQSVLNGLNTAYLSQVQTSGQESGLILEINIPYIIKSTDLTALSEQAN